MLYTGYSKRMGRSPKEYAFSGKMSRIKVVKFEVDLQMTLKVKFKVTKR